MGKVLDFLWSQWNTLTAGGSTKLTPDQYHAIQDGIHIQDVNIDALKASKLVGDVTNTRSSSGCLPGTMQFKTVNGVNNATSYINFGEGVWRVSDIIANYTGGSGTLYFRAYYYDQSTALQWFYGSTTSSSSFSYNADTEFDEIATHRYGGDMYLGLKPSGTFDADSMTIYVVCYRVR